MSENTEKRYWVGETTFPENGKMVYALSDGEPITGMVYATYEDGSILFECGYKNGKQHGLLKSWYDDGQILSECYLKDGQTWLNQILAQGRGTRLRRKLY